MNNTKTSIEYEVLENKNTNELYESFLALEPKPVFFTVPDAVSRVEQREAFLAGGIDNPNHNYSLLESYTADDVSQLSAVGKALTSSVDNLTQRVMYQDFVRGHETVGKMMLAMNEVRRADTDKSRLSVSGRFMDLNIKRYGEPSLAVYESLLTEKARTVLNKKTVGHAREIQYELAGLLPETIQENVESGEMPGRYRPSSEAMAWMKRVSTSLYGDMLKHIPDEKRFTPHQVADVFQNIIDNEFGGSADNWKVVVDTARAINVITGEKLIKIPDDMKSVSYEKLRTLVVHEIGVHLLRSVTGSETDLGLLGSGIPGYYATEEGLGVVMEQSITGKFREAGVDHYISAGAAYYDNMNFRQMFEMKWRIKALEKVGEDGKLTEVQINESRDFAYGNVMRSLRGTDSLPWFKDLAYYNGAIEVWKYLDSILGDDLQLSILLHGKVDTSKRHQKIILESNTAIA